MNENYKFQWDHLGDIEKGRPNLGKETKVSVYRLMQYTMRDIIASELGDEKAEEFFKNSGKLAGKEFCKNVLDMNLDFSDFIEDLKEKLIEFKIGILRVEKLDTDSLEMSVTVSEDLDCSGLPVLGVEFCDYDEGFISGILEEYTGKTFSVKEVDCWSTGERTCRFQIQQKV